MCLGAEILRRCAFGIRELGVRGLTFGTAGGWDRTCRCGPNVAAADRDEIRQPT
jgi:hypothetical protein